MSRPSRERVVAKLPEYNYFKPKGVPLRQNGEIALSIEEMEALRLADIEGVDQMPAALAMDVSKPTFNRILSGARTKVAKALWCGAALRIEGGNYRIGCDSGRHGSGHGRHCRHGQQSVENRELSGEAVTASPENTVVERGIE